MPQTYASLTERLQALDRVLRKHEPSVAWRLMRSLVPTSHDTLWPSSRPRWRDFSEGRSEEAVTTPLWVQGAEEIAKRLLEDVGTNPGRWTSLLEHLPDFFPERRREAIKLLSERLEKFDTQTRTSLWGAVRTLLNKHRRFAGSDWALPAGELAPLDPIYERLTPNGQWERISWLFVNGQVPLPNPVAQDWEADEAESAALRQRAVEEILRTETPDALFNFARTVESRFSVGIAIADANIVDDRREALLVQSLKGDEQLIEVARGIVLGCLKQKDVEWGYKLLDRAATEGWTKDMILVVALMMRESRRLWDRVGAFGEEIQNEYWRQVPSISVAGVAGEGMFVIGKLLSAGRARGAVSVAARQRNVIPSATLVEVLEKALVEPLSEKHIDFDVSNFQYYLEHVLQELDTRRDIDDSAIAGLEWAYCPVLRHSERSLSALHRRLASKPEFFAEVIGIIYRPDPESGVPEAPADSPERREEMFERAYQLLTSWNRIPGHDGGSVDGASLEQWIKEARRNCAAAGRAAVGDRHIGSMLAHAPAEADAVWPAIPVRDAIEVFRSADIERGVLTGLIQKRGPTWRAMNDGGDQERELSAHYRRSSEATRIDWPRTSAMLERIAQYYEGEGRQHDQDVEKRDWS
jgi:hypothetical protein